MAGHLGPSAPPWLVERCAELLDVPETAIHMLITEDNGAREADTPQACKEPGWWPMADGSRRIIPQGKVPPT